MKKLICIFVLLMTLTALAVPAFARTNAKQMDYKAVVDKDGGCNVTIVADLHIDELVTDPVFAVPSNAEDVKLNGQAVNTTSSEINQLISLKGITGGAEGDYSVTVTYRLKNLVKSREGDTMLLTVPILSDFYYPATALKPQFSADFL